MGVTRKTGKRTGRIRSGDEPSHARSPLRLRLWLTVVGIANAVAGVILFALLGSVPLVIAFAVLGVVALINFAIVVRHLRQGAHYQPGRAVPPYRPVEEPAPAREPHLLTPVRTRRRRYVIMMGFCLLLIILAWGWIRFYSVTAAAVMSLVAALIPPFAAIITNADSPITRPGVRSEDDVADQNDEKPPQERPDDRDGGGY
jgi:Family of unknown function (DUF6343)/Protein of unknown function (DUF3099)